jgi:hypothetical protein
MTEQLTNAPLSFWLQLVVSLALIGEAIHQWNAPWAKPALAVYGTVLFWYTGDYLTSDKTDYIMFKDSTLSLGFLQVLLFLLCFRWFLPRLSKYFSREPLAARRRRILAGRVRPTGTFSPRFLWSVLLLLILIWLVIFGIGVYHAQHLWPALIWPPLNHEKVGMYPVVAMGSGSTFIFAAVGYIHILIGAMFGVLAVIGRGPVRWIAVLMICLSWPYFWFDRARNKMLALMIPAFGAFWVASRRPLMVKVAVTLLVVFATGFWFARVMASRSGEGMAAFSSQEERGDRRQLGQDMLKELCWVNTYLGEGSLKPNLGMRYLAELANPIPRALWAGKPTVGIDYSILRGFGGGQDLHGVHATVSTGMIGQGCVNFGRFFGVVAASGLFALWAAFLSRLWVQRASPLRFALFAIGLGLTFNTGRDLTFLVLFPFAFGYLTVLAYERLIIGKATGGPRTMSRSKIHRKSPPPADA